MIYQPIWPVRVLHIRVVWTIPSGTAQRMCLRWVFDVTGLTVQTVGCVNLKAQQRLQ